MVYCDECGTENAEDAEFCSKCGTSLKSDKNERRRYKDRYRHRQRNECFGLPYGGMIVGIFFGVLLILFGISSIYGFNIWQYIGPIVIILIGLLIILGAIYSYRNRY